MNLTGRKFSIYGIVGAAAGNGWIGIENRREFTGNGSRSIETVPTGDTFKTFKSGEEWTARMNRVVANQLQEGC